MEAIIGLERPKTNTTLSVVSIDPEGAFAASVEHGGTSEQRGRSAQPDAALGTYTKSSPQNITPESLQAIKLAGLRADRYRLQLSSRVLFLAEYRSKNNGASVIPIEDYNKMNRVVKCTRTKVDFEVSVHKSEDSGKCFYSGLAVCGSVWCCPVCSAKIQERRREEIAQGMEWAYSNEKTCVMVTLTMPHYRNQSCSELLENQKNALTHFRKSGEWSRKMKEFGFEGLIRSLEVTYGDNGWHPHTHEIWILDKSFNRTEFLKLINKRWELSCKKFNLIPRGKVQAFRDHAIDVHFDASSSDYLAKQDDESNLSYWGADREVAKGMSKKSKGLHPFQLLDAFSRGEVSKGSLFLEYAKAFKGKRQIFWSPKLKNKIGLNDKSDQEIVEEKEEKAYVLSTLNTHAWQVVLDQDARAEILFIAENQGPVGLEVWFKRFGVDLFSDSYRSFKLRDEDCDVSTNEIFIGDQTLITLS